MDDLSVSPPPCQALGDYDLAKLLEQGQLTRTFLAVQRSVNREVLLDQLREELATPEIIEGFFADVRAKAAIDHPLIGSVYEAVSRPDAHFFTHEKLAGRSLLELAEAGVQLAPLEMARLLKRVADANLYLEARGICTAALAPDHVFVEDQGLTRMVNMAMAGTRSEHAYVADIQMLGHFLGDLIGTEIEGSTRVRTLLGWMADLQRNQPLTWEQILNYAEQVEQQLTATTFAAQPAPTRRADERPPKNLPIMIAGIAVALAVVIGAAWLVTRPSEPKAPRQRDLSAVVTVPAGTYPTPDESRVELGAFRIDAHEVSIGEYQVFLTELGILETAAKNAFDHVEQPASKPSHAPDGWEAMLAAAKSGGLWQNAPIDLNYPVVRIDWWDAYAYARWKHGRLPTQNEWFAAASQGAGDLAQLRAAAWGPVDAESPDILPNGLHGMAGNVAEWTGENELNPSVPMAPRRPLVIGASHAQPAGGAKAREWVDARSLRRDDLGFRVVYDGGE
jgi:hypothetical protein